MNSQNKKILINLGLLSVVTVVSTISIVSCKKNNKNPSLVPKTNKASISAKTNLTAQAFNLNNLTVDESLTKITKEWILNNKAKLLNGNLDKLVNHSQIINLKAIKDPKSNTKMIVNFSIKKNAFTDLDKTKTTDNINFKIEISNFKVISNEDDYLTKINWIKKNIFFKVNDKNKWAENVKDNEINWIINEKKEININELQIVIHEKKGDKKTGILSFKATFILNGISHLIDEPFLIYGFWTYQNIINDLKDQIIFSPKIKTHLPTKLDSNDLFYKEFNINWQEGNKYNFKLNQELDIVFSNVNIDDKQKFVSFNFMLQFRNEREIKSSLKNVLISYDKTYEKTYDGFKKFLRNEISPKFSIKTFSDVFIGKLEKDNPPYSNSIINWAIENKYMFWEFDSNGLFWKQSGFGKNNNVIYNDYFNIDSSIKNNYLSYIENEMKEHNFLKPDQTLELMNFYWIPEIKSQNDDTTVVTIKPMGFGFVIKNRDGSITNKITEEITITDKGGLIENSYYSNLYNYDAKIVSEQVALVNNLSKYCIALPFYIKNGFNTDIVNKIDNRIYLVWDNKSWISVNTDSRLQYKTDKKINIFWKKIKQDPINKTLELTFELEYQGVKGPITTKIVNNWEYQENLNFSS